MCPIGQTFMIDPVVVSSGQTFERVNIIDHMRVNGLLCPSTRKPLKRNEIIPNTAIKSLV